MNIKDQDFIRYATKEEVVSYYESGGYFKPRLEKNKIIVIDPCAKPPTFERSMGLVKDHVIFESDSTIYHIYRDADYIKDKQNKLRIENNKIDKVRQYLREEKARQERKVESAPQ